MLTVDQALLAASAINHEGLRKQSGSISMTAGMTARRLGSRDRVLLAWQGAAAPMFPFEDADEEWDDYGAVLRPGEFQSVEAYDMGGASLLR